MTVHITRRAGLPKLNIGKFRRRVQKLCRLLDLEKQELSFLLTDDQEMTELNRTFRGHNRTTDVLSFSQREGERGHLHQQMLGDVVISVPQAQKQANQRQVDLLAEMILLMVHGTLHLLGYDHVGVDRKSAAAMRRKQDQLIDALEVRNRG